MTEAITLKGLRLGQSASVRRTFTAAEVAEYTALTGDTGFEPGTVPGPLLGGMISDLYGTKLPGRGANWLKQRYSFPAPARVGEAVTATVEVIRLRPEKDLVNLRVTLVRSDGVVVGRGEGLVLAADLESAKE